MQDQKESNRKSTTIREALAVFFKYIDETYPTGTASLEPTPQVNWAFEHIVNYYTKRLKRYLKITPCHSLRRFIPMQDFHQEIFAKFWENAHKIENRSVGGVFSYLRSIARNHIINVLRDNQKEKENLTDIPDDVSPDKFFKSNMMNCLLTEGEKEIGMRSERKFGLEDAEFQFDVLFGFYCGAFDTLLPSEQQAFSLLIKGYSITEIAECMNKSYNAAKKLNQRAKEKLSHTMLKHMKAELNAIEFSNKTIDQYRCPVISYWYNRFTINIES